MSSPFVHLHVHSEYSLLDGASRIEDLVLQAKKLGMTALALTDHGVMYGTIPFYKACRKHGLNPVIGVEVYVTNRPLDAKIKKGEHRYEHLLLLAETYIGYQNLMRLTTKAHLEGFYYKPRVTKQWLEQYSEGIICLSACLAGELSRAVLQGHSEKAQQIVAEHRRIFGADNYFIELQDHGLPEQKMVNQRLIRLAQEMNIPLVVTNDVHYTFAEDAVAHDCLLCIGTGAKVDDEERLKFTGTQYYLKSSAEMEQLFPHLPEAYANTVAIAARCQVEIPLGQEILPQFPVPAGSTAELFLREQCWQGLPTRYPHLDGGEEQIRRSEIGQRLEYELQIISQMGYADYFLIVWDFMRFAHQQGIMTGPGRGSAAGSLVAYVLHITNIDPVRYGLLFERFLNPERVTMPDIDIDFSDQRRDEVIRYVANKYGREHVAQIITFGTLGAKAAVRDVGRVLNIPLHVVDRVAKNIRSGPQVTLEQALGESEQLQKMKHESAQVSRIFEIASQLEGLARHSSTHAAGVVIAAQPLTEYVPLQEGHDGIALTQYPMEALEEIGLLKMDFLGLSNLSFMEEILRIIKQSDPGQPLLQPDHIPLDDEATFALLSSGETSGIFQLESDGMRRVLKRLKPTMFEDLIAVLALYRPGPMENIPLFIDAKHGKTNITYPHPDLESILKPTYGIIVYQEQIMQIAALMAGFSLGEADLLRRAVSKKQRDILEQERSHFVRGCVQKGYEQSVAEHVYDLIVRFANYGFNRSHAAAYAVIAYQLAYLKARHPVAFLATSLSKNKGSEEKMTDDMSQAKQRGIRLLSPSVQHSQYHFTVENKAIRFGLGVIKHVNSAAIQEIVTQRNNKPFQSVLDFCQRVNLKICTRRIIENLVMAGALDDLGMHRAQVLANLDDIIDMSERAQGLRDDDQLFFFADELPDDYEWEDVPKLTPVERLEYEKEALGFYLSGHPLDAYRKAALAHGAVPIAELLQQADHNGRFEQQKVRTLGYVSTVRRVRTKKGDHMAFADLEDQGRVLDLVIFPTVFREQLNLYRQGQMIFVEGKLEERNEQRQLIVERAIEISRITSPASDDVRDDEQKLFIKITPEVEHSLKLQQLKKLLKSNQGKTPVFLYYESRKSTLQLDYAVQVSAALVGQLQHLLQNEAAVKLH